MTPGSVPPLELPRHCITHSPVEFFNKLGLSMKFISFLAFYLNHKQFVATTKIIRRNTMHKYTRSILGNTSQQGKKNKSILCYIIQDKYLHHHKYLAHEGSHKP